ncbi:MAG: LytTR family DNA-binding domain-containing protein [Bacteroidales bacterium]|nr:LytTR family DNA-binding domain-containing protein [Bacteroidales bacterium]
MNQSNIKAVILDGKESSETELNELIFNVPILKNIGTFSSVSDIISILEKENPIIVFLSDNVINDQNITLFNELHQEGYSFYVIVIAENNHSAFDAFKLAAIAYMVKPITKQYFSQTIEDAVIAIINHELHLKAHPIPPHFNNNRRYRFNTRNGFILTIPDHIIYIEADWNYSEMFLSNGKSEILSMSIGHLEKILHSDEFYRINRSFIVNLNHVKKVDRKMRLCCMEINGNEKELKIATKNLKELDRRLS